MSTRTIISGVTTAIMTVAVLVGPYGWPVAIAGGLVLGGASAAMSNATEGSFGDGDFRSPPLDGGVKLNTRSTEEPIPVIYGQLKVGGNDVYITATGTNNDILWIVQTISEGECDSIESSGGVDQLWLGDKLWNEYGGNVSYYFHSGSTTQTKDANLYAVKNEWTDTLKNTCYIVWKLTYDRDYFQGIPRRNTLLNGRKLFDFRDDTTGYSNNPVLCLYDYITNARYGLGVDSTNLDTTTWTAAANYCDIKGWTLNYAVNKNQLAHDVIDAVLLHFRGKLVWYDGKYYLRYSDLNYESSAMTLEDEHIVQSPSGESSMFITQPSRFKRPDAIRVAYIDPDKEYVTDYVTVGDTTGVVRELRLSGCTDRQQASDLGVYELERQQLDRVVGGFFRDDALQLEAHDPITLNTTALGISGQIMRVLDAQIQNDGLIALSFAYESTGLYDDDYNLDADGVYNCSLPDINAEPASVSNVVLTEDTYNYRLRTFTRVNVTFDLPASYPWLKHIEIWLSYDNATWEHLFNVTGDFQIDPVEEGVTYYLKFKTVSIWGTKRTDGNSYVASLLIEGRTASPESLTSLSLLANGNAINIWSSKVSDADVELYEFRLGTSWNGSIFLAALRSPNLSLVGVKPGSHTFFCNTLANNGVYGSTPRSQSVELKDPPDAWTEDGVSPFSDDFL